MNRPKSKFRRPTKQFGPTQLQSSKIDFPTCTMSVVDFVLANAALVIDVTFQFGAVPGEARREDASRRGRRFEFLAVATFLAGSCVSYKFVFGSCLVEGILFEVVVVGKDFSCSEKVVCWICFVGRCCVEKKVVRRIRFVGRKSVEGCSEKVC